MNDNISIKVENVSKKYCKSLKRSMLYGVKDIARNTFGLSSHSDKLRKNEFWAVDDVSFKVKKGESLGIIGPNGSGKTTMLKLLNGIFWPDKGKISIKGKVGALIEVGAGFHPLLTGRENIYINAAILGMTKEETDKKFDAIVEFADIGDFLDVPVKHYSSGMFVRLGFSVAVHCEPDILLVDEVLAVGDMIFQNKCINRMKELQNQQKTIVFISHNLIAVESICIKSIWMQEGILKFFGDTKETIKEYFTETNKFQIEQRRLSLPLHHEGTGEVKITNLELTDGSENRKKQFCTGDEMQIRIEYYACKRIEKPSFAVIINDLSSNRIFISHTKIMECSIQYIEGNGVAICSIPTLPLLQGAYYIDVYINDKTNLINYTMLINASLFTVSYSVNSNKLIRMSGKMGLVSVLTEWRYQ